jgi:putative addiction module component (TIGR02574 family)
VIILDEGLVEERIVMSPLMQSLGIDRLSVAERLQLVQEIWDSIADEQDQIPLTEEQKKEIDRRLEAYRANPDSGIPWEVVRARAEERLRK